MLCGFRSCASTSSALAHFFEVHDSQESFKDLQKKIQAWVLDVRLPVEHLGRRSIFSSMVSRLATQLEDPGRNWKIYVAHAPGKWTTSVVCRPVRSVYQQGNESRIIHL